MRTEPLAGIFCRAPAARWAWRGSRPVAADRGGGGTCAHDGRRRTRPTAAISRLHAAQARDVDAIASQIVPSGATPGAHEAGVVYFVDQVHNGIWAAGASDFIAGLTAFQAACAKHHPGVAQFADLSCDDQTGVPEARRAHAVLRADAVPDGAGLARPCPRMAATPASSAGSSSASVDQHVWEPPFGYYDKEYTGFVPYAEQPRSSSHDRPHVQAERHRRLRRRGLGRRRRRHGARTVAGRVRRAGARAGAALHRRRLQARRTRLLVQRRITNKLDTNPQTFRKTPHEMAKRVRDFPAAWYAPMVGGSSNHFTANFWRFHEVDFNERSLLGAIPGTTFADWPITYAELEPYYTKVEWEIGVSGLAGASPFDPPRSKPYPMPPLPVKSSGVLLERGARKLGLHPFPAPMAIASQPYRGRAACAHCGFCIGFGCEMQAKSSTLVHHDSRGRSDGSLRSAQRQLRRRASRPTPRVAPPASRISTRTSASTSRRHAPSSSARTAPKRRDCC